MLEKGRRLCLASVRSETINDDQNIDFYPNWHYNCYFNKVSIVAKAHSKHRHQHF